MSDPIYNTWTLKFRDQQTNKNFTNYILKDELIAFRSLCVIGIALELVMIVVDLNRVTFANDILKYRSLDLALFFAGAIFFSIFDLKRVSYYQTVYACIFIIHFYILILIDYNTQIPSFFLSNAFITTIYLTVVVGGLRFINSSLCVIGTTILFIYYAIRISPNADLLSTQATNVSINLFTALVIGYLTERMKIHSFLSKNLLDIQAIKTEATNKTKDELLNLIAIDLKSPVIELENTFNRLRHEASLPEGLKPQISQMSTRFTSISHLLVNLGQWSEAQLKHTKVEKETFNVNDLIFSIKPLFNETIADNNITLILPEKGKSHYITADKKMVVTIIRNLLSNALKFASHYGVVRIITSSNESFTTISFNNDGPGIPKEKLKGLFSVDSNVVKDALNRGRSGLSLAVCKSFTELNDGEISVDSIEGDGTTFHIKFRSAF